MRVNAKLLATASAALIVIGISTVRAADTDTKTPGAQGLMSVDKNLNRDPDNRGLTNAQTRIEDNMQDRAQRKATKTAHKDKDKMHHDRPEKAEHADKADRPERPQHPERAGR